ncbi:GLPGLI family protein [Flavobacterium azooxidireducens]|uniref:GLPGLI family protein n=1 Tax=Flavobacterium azooxidireducens TaxID=1871076 RepID=A0ABY4KAL4_9FLAO|nr:GLPGLI family protein [Flavobacterium azooxidireducens]UPQ77841.1 GLPGLI family protein [Flavobacterium azooxidireducens]
MKKLLIMIITATILFVVSSLKAQEFSGQAVYFSKTVMKGMKMKINGVEMSEAEQEKFEQRMNKMNEKTFFLDFNKYESVYYEEQKLDAPTSKSGMVFSSSDTEKIYKEIKTNQKMAEKDFFGKEFLIVDSLPNWNWQLEGETKKIGDYTCYKAVSIKKATSEELADYEESKKKQEQSKTSFFMMSEPKDRVTTVWYTPEIPVSQGPGEFWGLPGLILEASFDDTTILCSKVVINPKEKIRINKPKKGKKITEKEYDKIVEDKLSEYKDGDGVIQIKIDKN